MKMNVDINICNKAVDEMCSSLKNKEIDDYIEGEDLTTLLLDKYAAFHRFAERDARDAREHERRSGKQARSTVIASSKELAREIDEWRAARDNPPCDDSWTSTTWRVHPVAKELLDDHFWLEKQLICSLRSHADI